MKKRLTDPKGEGLADDLIGNDPEPIAGWYEFVTDANGRLVRVPPKLPDAFQDLENEFDQDRVARRRWAG